MPTREELAYVNGEDLKKKDAVEALSLASTSHRTAAAPLAPPMRRYEDLHMSVGVEYFPQRTHGIDQGEGSCETELAQYSKHIFATDAAYRDLVRARIYQRLLVGWAGGFRVEDTELENELSSASPGIRNTLTLNIGWRLA